MAKAANKPPTIDVHERNLLDETKLGLASAEVMTIREVVDLRPVKVEIEVLLPEGAGELQEKTIQIQSKAAIREVTEKYVGLLGKAAASCFKFICEKHREDQAGKSGSHSAAESALSKLNKFIENSMEDYRMDLRESIGKRLDINPKELMTVGRVSTKEMTILAGTFKSEFEFGKEEPVGKDVETALKKKKWQYCGAAFSAGSGRIAIGSKKEFTAGELKKMAELFPQGERGSLKYANGRIQADSETKLEFEFAKGEKLPGAADNVRRLLMKGIKEQLDRNLSDVNVKIVDAYTMDAKPQATKPESTETPPKTPPTVPPKPTAKTPPPLPPKPKTPPQGKKPSPTPPPLPPKKKPS